MNEPIIYTAMTLAEVLLTQAEKYRRELYPLMLGQTDVDASEFRKKFSEDRENRRSGIHECGAARRIEDGVAAEGRRALLTRMIRFRTRWL